MSELDNNFATGVALLLTQAATGAAIAAATAAAFRTQQFLLSV